MGEWLKTILLVLGVLVAGASAVIVWVQARIARRALKQTQLIHLFQGFDTASQMTLQHPELLYDVHGLDRSVSEDEARAIAYLLSCWTDSSISMDRKTTEITPSWRRR